tara:strand:- start:4 stop:648 length:645 start_codon:yes stop_codon:yes gene_type:complete
MDNETTGLFPKIDKDILKKMDEENIINEETPIAELKTKKKINHDKIFIKEQEGTEVAEEELEAVKEVVSTPIKKKKEYPHLVKARATAKANREAKKQAKLEAKLQSKQATKIKRLEKQRLASKERYWKNKEEEEEKQPTLNEYSTIQQKPPQMNYNKFREYQIQYEKEKQQLKLAKDKTKLEEENKRLKKQINTNSFNRNPNYPNYFNTGNRFF